MIALASAALLGALAGCGHGSAIPKSQQSAILERAKAEGIISDYRAVGFRCDLGRWRYSALGGELALHYSPRCAPNQSCPGSAECGTLWIDYRHTTAEVASRILPIARAWARRTCSGKSMEAGPPDYRWHVVASGGIRVIFGPPYYR